MRRPNLRANPLTSPAARAAMEANATARPAATRSVLRLTVADHLAHNVIRVQARGKQLSPDLVRHVDERLSAPIPGVVKNAIAREIRYDRRAEVALPVLGDEGERRQTSELLVGAMVGGEVYDQVDASADHPPHDVRSKVPVSGHRQHLQTVERRLRVAGVKGR